MSRSEIEQLGVRTLIELLNYVPGFQSLMTYQESGSSLILAKGLSNNFGRNLLLMVDGHRINEEYTGGFTYLDRLMSLYNVKQVEFIRGFGSTLYGSNAFSGVINIIADKRKKFTVLLGNNQSKGVTVSAYGELGQRNGNVSVVAGDKISVLQNQNALVLTNGKVIYKPKNHWSLGFSVRNLFDIQHAVPRHNSVGIDEFGRSIQEFSSHGRELYLTLNYANSK